ncbi:TAXI family TRAP transporter solute-binding subunit [Rhodoblastus sp.]|uniref:TAXI family TRAP transporter solute-binding subunit n=1 Tax=Rhodoblastus sp. TaxID=1962975 RepID=UPI0035B088D8
MSNLQRRIVALIALVLALGLGAAAWRFLSQPKILAVAVGPANSDDSDFIAAWSRVLAADGGHLRLKAVPTSGPAESLEKLKKGEVALAVARIDLGASEKMRAVAVLHSDPVVIVAPEKAKIDTFARLKGKSLGVIGPPHANDVLIDTLRRHYRADPNVVALPPTPAEIVAAFREGKVDALLFVAPTTRSATVADNWSTTRRAMGKALAITPIDEGDAIAEASPVYESGEIPAGLFGASPPTPAEEVATLRTSTYLLADRGLSDRTIGQLTRNLFENRQRIAADTAVANLVKAASVDKDAVIPVHPGAQVYYDGEETGLVEQYGDWLYYGPLLLGGIASAVMASLRFLGFTRHDETSESLLAKVPEVIALIKSAQTTQELDEIRARIDLAVERFTHDVVEGSVEEQKTAPIALAVDYLGRMISERRAELARAAKA